MKMCPTCKTYSFLYIPRLQRYVCGSCNRVENDQEKEESTKKIKEAAEKGEYRELYSE